MVTEAIQEEITEFQNDRHCKDAFQSVSIEEFRRKIQIRILQLIDL